MRRACRKCFPRNCVWVFFEVGGGENVPGIAGAYTTRYSMYLVRGPCDDWILHSARFKREAGTGISYPLRSHYMKHKWREINIFIYTHTNVQASGLLLVVMITDYLASRKLGRESKCASISHTDVNAINSYSIQHNQLYLKFNLVSLCPLKAMERQQSPRRWFVYLHSTTKTPTKNNLYMKKFNLNRFPHVDAI